MELQEARKVIEECGLVVFPTETAYGIAADATNPDAVEKVYEAKQRPQEKGLTAIVSSLEQAERYAKLSDNERKIVKELMPGPITLVSEKKDRIPDSMNEKFVFRVSSSKTARTLAENIPITATSANISGEETSYSIEDISDKLLEKVDFVIDTGKLEDGPTSTITEIVDGEVVIHREGPIKKKEIEKVVE
ncbi:MAG: threonylcarbamoyl-AMP synthase [Nanohaloarchaea archaeon]|nr:threonylcarbamoyl-AMP synthase [Candidatus Nanohaloarchaea archaeon]